MGVRRTWTDEQFIDAVKNNETVADVIKELGLYLGRGNYQTIYRNVKRLDLDTSHWLGRGFNKERPNNWSKTPNEKIFIENSYFHAQGVKDRVIKENLIEYKCQKCGIEREWQGELLVLQLDHINGIHNDNRLDNLRFLCPNCHSQTNNWSGRKNRSDVTYKCESCGTQTKGKGKICLRCASLRQKTKIDWPPTEDLISMVKTSSYVAVAKKLGVSDNAVRFRIKRH